MSQNWLSKINRVTGLDRAVGYTVLARGLQIVGSAGTVLLIVSFLSPEEQGYYYTLLSLVSMQVIFELGFSFVILQMAAHESVHLRFYQDGRIEGDEAAHSRLGSVLQKTLRWYLLASAAMLTILLPVGTVFLSRHFRAGSDVAWQGPWVFAVIGTVALFLLNPIFSFLEGCGQVQQVAAVRFAQGVAAIVVPWSVLSAHRGLYSPGAVNVGYFIVGLLFVWSRRKLLVSLLRYPVGQNAVSWRREVWPFQWRTGVCFLGSYFTAQIFIPLLFAFRGPVEAGRMGMSMSVAGYLWTVVFAWMSTKATSFGTLVARAKFDELDRLFFQTLKQSLAVLGVIAVGCMGMLVALQNTFPNFAARMLQPQVFALLLLTAVSTFVVQSMAVYLRAHKSEPFLLQSLLVAVLTCGGGLLLVPRWGMLGAAMTYSFSTGAVGLIIAIAVFQSKRRSRNWSHLNDCV